VLALKLVEEAIELDAEFTEAWALKSSIHSSFVLFGPLDRRAVEQDEAERAASHAIELDGSSAEAWAEYGFALSQRSKPVEAERAFRTAEELGGRSPLGAYGILLLSAANFAKARANFERFRAVDPWAPDARAFLLVAYGFEGRIDAATEEYEEGRTWYDTWGFGDYARMWILLGRDDTAEALEGLERRIGLVPINDPVRAIDTAARDNFASPSDAVARLRELRADPNVNLPALVAITMWAAYFDDAELALDVMQEMVAVSSQSVYLFWFPQMREVRRLPGFKTIMREAGFVDYWNEFGWPEACRPTAGDDFECD
jgi:tetratricopeptide (TPR) repeat protein